MKRSYFKVYDMECKFESCHDGELYNQLIAVYKTDFGVSKFRRANLNDLDRLEIRYGILGACDMEQMDLSFDDIKTDCREVLIKELFDPERVK